MLFSCNSVKQDSKDLIIETQKLLELQESAIQDSIIDSEELSKLETQIDKISEISTKLNESYDNDKKSELCQIISNNTYDLIQKANHTNWNMFYVLNSSKYITYTENLNNNNITDCQSWSELISLISFSDAAGKAQNAFSKQYQFANCQIIASEDNIFTDDEIDEIIKYFKISFETYNELYSYYDKNPEKRKDFESAISRISDRYREINEGKISKLIHCKNYNKLDSIMTITVNEQQLKK